MKPDIIDELFRKYYNEAMLYTMSLCKNETAAEDIVSTAFYKALASADDDIKNFKPWLLTVCRNEFFGLCRKNKAMSYDELTEEIEDDSGEIVDRLILKEEYRALYHAIDKLNAAQREVIMLFYFSGLQIKDIATVTGKSESNVKVLLYRSRERLKELMEVAG
jgi:RNA polymerase sigma-70 factor, ECF subfamily